MSSISDTEIHNRALEMATQYKKCEADLFRIFRELDETKAFLHFGGNSLFDYSVRILGLSEATTSNLITVARKSREVPELKVAIESGTLSVSKAKKISAVITPSNQERWLSLAKSQTSRVIEKEVARENPSMAVREKIKYKTAERLEISFGISEDLEAKLARAKDLIAQKTGATVSSEKALEVLLSDYLERHDPIEKAKRSKMKSDRASLDENHTYLKINSTEQVPGPVSKAAVSQVKSLRHGKSARAKLSAKITHQVNLRDRAQCTHEKDGLRCANKKWLEVHHVKPISRGGTDAIENLTTLCSSHHRMRHR